MKIVLHKSTCIIMAFLLLLTTTSFTVDAHFCGDHLVDIAIFEGAQSCEMQEIDPDMHDLMQDMGCCKDKQIVSDVDKDLQKSSSDFSTEQLVFLIAFTHSLPYRFDILHTELPSHGIKESPPLIKDDLVLLHDSFLI